MKRRSHTGHANFFSPVCVRLWRESSSERANFLSQSSQLQLKGFSPERKGGGNCNHKGTGSNTARGSGIAKNEQQLRN